MKGQNLLLMASASAIGAVLLVFAVVPMLSASTPEDELGTETPSPSPEEEPVFDDEGYFSNEKEHWFPRNVPSTGSPHLIVQDLVAMPEEGEGKAAPMIHVRYDDAAWLQPALENDNIPTKLESDSLSEFYAVYDEQDTFTPYFEVTFPDGSVNYYEIMLVEVP